LPSTVALLAAFLLSGASGLVYEVVWARQIALLAGGTAHASQAVLATFFVGLMAGAFLFGRRAARARDGRRFYARLELGIAAAGALSGVVLAALRGPAAAASSGADGAGSAAIALGITLAACLPATLLMGATFAAVARALEPATQVHGEALLGRAYAVNTMGAVLGSVGGAFVALPALGVRGTLAAAIAGNLAAAGLARASVRGEARMVPAAAPEAPPAPRLPVPLAAALALSGFAAISLEVVALRVLAVTLKDTVYTFAVAVAAYIAGAAATAALLGRRQQPTSLPPALTLALAALLSALWLPTLRLGERMVGALVDPGAGFAYGVSVEALVALLLAAPAAVPTTWVFLTLAAHPAVGTPAAGAGKATAWNGLGCALAPLAAAMVLLPAGGTVALAAVGVAALAVAALGFMPEGTRRTKGATVAMLGAAAVVVFAVRGGLHGWTVTPGWRLVFTQEGASVAVSIEESDAGQRRLRTNNNFTEGGDAASISQIRQGMFPTLLAPDARRVLVLGVGSGITLAGSVAGLPDARFDAVELIPEIRRAVGAFARSNGGVGERPNVTLHVADARTFAAHAARAGERYDLVVGELFHASQAGTGALYAREHFRTVASLLNAGGLFCQWLPLHETPPAQVRTIVRTFFRVFPHGTAIFGSWTMSTPILGLVGSATPLVLDLTATAQRLTAPPERAARAAASEIARLPETVAAFIAPAEALRRWAGDGPENSDDRPELELGAPRGRAPETPPDNVMALLEVWQPPDALVHWGPWQRRDDVVAAQGAIAAYFRGTFAWMHEDLGRAEADLRRAYELGPTLPFTGRALQDLATNWRMVGRPERERALLAWLEARAAR
jgi:spermidine synthase